MSEELQNEVPNNLDQPNNTDAPRIIVEAPRNSPWIAILSLLLVATLSLAGYFYWQNISLREATNTPLQESPSPLPTPLESPIIEDDQPVTSQTYSDSQFSFQFPLGWDTYQSTGENQNSLFVAPQDRIQEIKRLFDSGFGFGGGAFLTMIISPTEKIEEAVSDEYSQTTVSTVLVDELESQLQTTRVTQSSPMGQPGDMLYTIYVPNSGGYLRIQLVDGVYKSEFDQILSTFKFIKN